MAFRLAHLSDVHLGPLPRATAFTDYFSKRAIGYYSWQFKRRSLHDTAIVRDLISDIRAHAPDHVALTGDLINIALHREFESAAAWLREFGEPSWITFVPGNHDAYVGVPWKMGAGLWADYMIGDMRTAGAATGPHLETPFPFVRQRKNIAIIGMSSAQPQGLRYARGTLGPDQREHLASALAMLREKGFFRIVLIHHPPLPGQSRSRKALTDTMEFRAIIEAEGAELVLSGHNHRSMQTSIDTRHGKCHLLAVPSATSRGSARMPAAAWNQYVIRRHEGHWNTEVTVRTLNPRLSGFETLTKFDLVN